MNESITHTGSTGLRAKRFSVSQLLTAGVAAVALVAGSFGLGLWPSAAVAQWSIRKFSGPLEILGNWVYVDVHNPHPDLHPQGDGRRPSCGRL